MQILSADSVIMKRLVQFMNYEDAITAVRKLGKISDLPALLVNYASFAYAVLENPNKSRQILSQLDKFSLTHPVIKAVIDLSSCFPEKDMLIQEFLDPLVQKYLSDGGLSTKSERREISLSIWIFWTTLEISTQLVWPLHGTFLFGYEPYASSFGTADAACDKKKIRCEKL